MPSHTTPKKKKGESSSLHLHRASVGLSPNTNTKEFDFTLGKKNKPHYETHDNEISSPTYDGGRTREEAKKEAEEQARLVKELLGDDGMNAGDIAAKYDVSDSDDDWLIPEEDEKTAKENAEAKDSGIEGFNWDEQLGGQVGALQESNSKLKMELDQKKSQVKKLGIMLHALEPIPGVDAEKLLNVVDERGEQLHHDMKDVKIVQMAKKIRQLTFELNKERGLGKKAEGALLMLDKELQRKQAEIDSLGTPAARALIAKTIVGGTERGNDENVLYGGGAKNDKEVKKLQASLEDMRNKFEMMKEKNRLLEHKLIQEVGGEGEMSERLEKIMQDGWRGRAQMVGMLKSKIKRLEASVKTGGIVDANGDARGLMTNRGAVNAPIATTAQQRVAANNLRRDVDFKAQQELNEMERMRQQGVEELSLAYEKVKEENDKLQRKFTSAKVRVGCLETDNAKLRDGMKVFVGKASTDDKLVDALRDEVASLKRKLRKQGEREMRIRDETRKESNEENSEMVLLRQQVSQLNSQNKHQERIINQMRADLHKIRNPKARVGAVNVKPPGE